MIFGEFSPFPFWRNVAYGVESATEETLRGLGRSKQFEEVKRAFSLIKKARIQAQAFVMFRLPEESVPEEPLRRNMGELFLPVLSLIVLGIIHAIVNRKRNKQFFFIFGIIWVIRVITGIILSLISPVGHVFSILGMVYITIGVYKWKKEKFPPELKE